MRQARIKCFLFCFYLLTIATLVMQAATARGAESPPVENPAKNNSLAKSSPERAPALEKRAARPERSLLQYAIAPASLQYEVVTFEPRKGHVFNLDAPNNCGQGTKLEATADSFRCQMTELGPQRVELFVCDEQKTFCTQEEQRTVVMEPREFREAILRSEGQASDQILARAGAPKRGTTEAQKKQPSPRRGNSISKEGLPGFLTSLPLARELARKKGELLLINYSAEFCPPCERLRTEVFPNAEFQDGTKNMTKVYVDTYDTESVDMLAPLNLYWTPTIVITTSDFQEIGRFSGYESTTELLREIREIAGYKDTPIAQAVAEYKKEKSLALRNQPSMASDDWKRLKRRVGLWYFYSREFEQSMEALLGLFDKDSRHAYLYAGMQLSARAKDWSNWSNYFRKFYLELGANNQSEVAYYLKSVAFGFAKKEVFDAYAPKFIALLNKQISGYDSKEATETKANLMKYRVAIQEKLSDVPNKDQVLQEQLTALAAEKSPETKYSKAIQDFDKVQAIISVGKLAEAAAETIAIVEQNPDSLPAHELAVYYLQNKLDRKEKAFEIAKAAIAIANGVNRTNAKISAAELAFDLGEKKLAGRYVNEALSEITVSKGQHSWGQHYMQSARKLQAKLEGRFFGE